MANPNDVAMAKNGDRNLSGADLIGANLTGADLYCADLTGAALMAANLRGADLDEANLTDADLRGANLRGANLINANLTRANLRGVDLTGADLREANLTDADLTGASLSGAIWSMGLDFLQAGAIHMTNKHPDGIEMTTSAPGHAPAYVEYHVWPEDVIFRSQQGAENKWVVYMNDHRLGGQISHIATFGEDEYDAANLAAMSAAEAIYRERVPADETR